MHCIFCLLRMEQSPAIDAARNGIWIVTESRICAAARAVSLERARRDHKTLLHLSVFGAFVGL